MSCTCDAVDTPLHKDPDHEDFCEEALITKREVVELIRNGAGSIIDDYNHWLSRDASSKDAKDGAVVQAVEDLKCFLDLHGGACRH